MSLSSGHFPRGWSTFLATVVACFLGFLGKAVGLPHAQEHHDGIISVTVDHRGGHTPMMRRAETPEEDEEEKELSNVLAALWGKDMDLSEDASAKVSSLFTIKDADITPTDYCLFNFFLGEPGQNSCNNDDPNGVKVMRADLCIEAGAQRQGTVPDKHEFLIPDDDNMVKTVKGCFKAPCHNDKINGCYFYNQIGEREQANVTGVPVCRRPQYVNGSVEGEGRCPDNYLPVMEEEACRQVASCLGYCVGAPDFRINLRDNWNYHFYPPGCFIHPADGCVYLNDQVKNVDGSKWGPPKFANGTQICAIPQLQDSGINGSIPAMPSDFTRVNETAACSTDIECGECSYGCQDGRCYSNAGKADECDAQNNGDDVPMYHEGFWCFDGYRKYMCKSTGESTMKSAEAACTSREDCGQCSKGCQDGKCYSSTGKFAECVGKPMNHKLGKGFFCFDGERRYKCKATKSS